ncbi:hypothetical protein LCGC14_1206860 [marine sediment metagenome]|uniref:Uncharacterized protein n=1 Tax=marine sediment metagenome TaxID=412755 RepID=A0A0F9LJL5_9ZZZZ
MIPGTIDGEQYPIAVDEDGNLQWQTAQVGQERDEVWDDWSLSLGETKRETGRGYLFARGWDASTRGALRLSPFYHNLNVTTLTTATGYMMEEVQSTGSSLVFDAASSKSGTPTTAAPLTFSHTVTTSDERILVLGISSSFAGTDSNIGAVPTWNRPTYGGVLLTRLVYKTNTSGGDIAAQIWYLLNPATGANTVSIQVSPAVSMVAAAVSWSGVNQDDPFNSSSTASGGQGTAVTVDVPSTSTDDEIIDTVAVDRAATFSQGANQTERWDDSPNSDVSGGGSTQDGVNGATMSSTLSASSFWATVAASIQPASTTSRPIIYYSDTTLIHNYTYDSDTGITAGSDRTVGGVAGRPAKVNGNWYSPAGSGANAEKLTNVTWADVTGAWKADHLSTFQKGVTPTVVRVNASTQHQIDFNEDTGDITDTWSGGQKAGDSSTKINELVEAQGELFACKEDNLYKFGVEAESFPVIPFIQRGKIDADNGKGSFAFGDEIVYMSKGNLWRYRIGRGALPLGLNTIHSWRKIDDIIDTPKDGRPAFGVHVGEYWYYLVNDGQESHLIQARKRREGDPGGHELIQHSVLTIPLSNALGVDSKNQLWVKGASTDETVRDIRIIELAEDGSLDVQNRRGQADADHDIWFDERNPGRPQDKVQIRHMTVELEGDWDSTTSLQLKLYRDDATTPTSIGSAITSSGMTVRNPTVGTNDTAFRIRPRLTLTTTSSYTPKNSDPQVLRVIVGIRFPEIIRIVINAEQMALDNVGLDPFEAEQNLRRLQNQGTVTFRRPGDYDDPATGTDLVTDRTFTGEVEGVTDIMYKTSEVDGVSSYAHGIELRVKRWVTY